MIAPAGLRENWRREAAAVGARIEIFSWAKVPEAIKSEFTLIADEAHYAQNMKAARTTRFLELAKAAKAVFCLSGTPIKNGRPANLFPLLVATKHDLAADRRRFERHYCAAGATRWSKWDVTGAAHLDELHEQIADRMLRRMKDECLDLPEKVRVLRTAELTTEAQALYDRTLYEMQAEYRRRVLAGDSLVALARKPDGAPVGPLVDHQALGRAVALREVSVGERFEIRVGVGPLAVLP